MFAASFGLDLTLRFQCDNSSPKIFKQLPVGEISREFFFRCFGQTSVFVDRRSEHIPGEVRANVAVSAVPQNFRHVGVVSDAGPALCVGRGDHSERYAVLLAVLNC